MHTSKKKLLIPKPHASDATYQAPKNMTTPPKEEEK